MKNFKYILSVAVAAAALASCGKEEALVLQNSDPEYIASRFDAQYYQNLRDFKESDHAITYIYYAAYSTLEGASSLYKLPTSMSERFIGLPDSLDFVNLWMGVPSGNPADEYNYSPVAYEDMQFCRSQKGTKFLMHGDASHDWTITLPDGTEATLYSGNDEAMQIYAQNILDTIYDNDIDGVDIDFEGWSSSLLTKLVLILGEKIGPKGSDPSKYLVVDYFGSAPSGDIDEYVNFVVRQAYSPQIGNRYSTLLSRPGWLAPEKYVICEQWNDCRNMGMTQGYTPYYGYNGEVLKTYDASGTGSDMASLEAYARFCLDGNAHGFGGYYMDSDYFYTAGPYYNLRRCIQIANPSIK